MSDFIDDMLEIERTATTRFDDPAANPHKQIAQRAERETFPCESCGGTGRYRGVRIHQQATECFSCKGKGYFFKSYKDRMEGKAKRAAKKAAKLDHAKGVFTEANPGLIEGLDKLSIWNSFARSLLVQYNEHGTLSDGQISAGYNQIEKAAARDAARAAERVQRTENAPVVETDKLKAALHTASSNGLKKPALRFDGFTVSEAPAHGKNPGALYIKGQYGEYLGKIAGGKLLATREAAANTSLMTTITAAMADPVATAIAYGKRTGHCSCCGRLLTDPVSVERGIGPICADHFGF